MAHACLRILLKQESFLSLVAINGCLRRVAGHAVIVGVLCSLRACGVRERLIPDIFASNQRQQITFGSVQRNIFYEDALAFGLKRRAISLQFR